MFKKQFLEELDNVLNREQKQYQIEQMDSSFLIKRLSDDKYIIELNCQNRQIITNERIGELYITTERLFEQLELRYKITIEIYSEFYETKNVLEQYGSIVLADTDYTIYTLSQAENRVDKLATVLNRNAINIIVLMNDDDNEI